LRKPSDLTLHLSLLPRLGRLARRVAEQGQGLLAPSSGDAEGALRPASVRRGTVVGALVAVASIRSGRGDRNQLTGRWSVAHSLMLQWGPVVVTGISE